MSEEAARIISVVNTKGGVGKSKLCKLLAFDKSIQKKFKKIALIELDRQRTVNEFWNKRIESGLKSKIDFFSVWDIHSAADAVLSFDSEPDEDLIQSFVAELIKRYDLLIIDVAGESVTQFQTLYACAVSDLVISPLRTTTEDEHAFADNMLPLIEKIIAANPSQKGKFFILPNFLHPCAKAAGVVEYFKDILPASVNCFEHVLKLRSAYENYDRSGHSLQEYTEQSHNKREISQLNKAFSEVNDLAKEIIKKL